MNSQESIAWNGKSNQFDVVLADGTSTVITNLIVLDFEGGENLSYRNEQLDLNVENITMTATVSEEDQVQILAKLNDNAADDTLFLSQADAEKFGLSSDTYSVIYTGSTDAFNFLGAVSGISETTGDYAAAAKNDKAFVITNNLSDANSIADTIAHEAGHLTGTLTHDAGNDGLTIDDYTSQTFTGATVTLAYTSSCAYYIFKPTDGTVRVYGTMGSWNVAEPTVGQNQNTCYNIASNCTLIVDDSVTISGTKLIFNFLKNDNYTGTVTIEKEISGTYTFDIYSDSVFNLMDCTVTSGSTLTIEQMSQGKRITMEDGKISGSGTLVLKGVSVSNDVDLGGFTGTVDAAVTEDMYNSFNATLRSRITTLQLYNSASSGTTTYTTAPDDGVTSLHLWSVNDWRINNSQVSSGTTLIYKGSLANRTVSVTLHGGAGQNDTIQLSSKMSGFSGSVCFDSDNSQSGYKRNFRFIVDTDMSLAASGHQSISKLTAWSQLGKYLVLTGNATIVQDYNEGNNGSATNLELRVGSLIDGYFTSARTEAATAGSTITIKGDDVLGSMLNSAKVGKYVMIDGAVTLGSNVTLKAGTTALSKDFLTSGGTSTVAQIYGYDTADDTSDNIYGALIYENNQLVLAWADSEDGVASAVTISTPEVNCVTYGTTIDSVSTETLSVFRGTTLTITSGSTYTGVLSGYTKVIGDASTGIEFNTANDILAADLSEFYGTITCASGITGVQTIDTNTSGSAWTSARILDGYNGTIGGYGTLKLDDTDARTITVDGSNGLTVSGGAATGVLNYDATGAVVNDTVYTGYTGSKTCLINGGTVGISDIAYLAKTDFSGFCGTIAVDNNEKLTALLSRDDVKNAGISVTEKLSGAITIEYDNLKALSFTKGVDDLTVNCGTFGTLSNRVAATNVTKFTGGTVTGDLNVTGGTLSGVVVGGTTGLGINTSLAGGTLALTNNTHIGDVMTYKGATSSTVVTDGSSTCITIDDTSSMGGFTGNQKYFKLNMTVSGTVNGTVTTKDQAWVNSTNGCNLDQITIKQTGTIDGNLKTGTASDYVTLDVGSWISGDVELAQNDSNVEGNNNEYIKITNTYGSGGGTTGHMANSTGAAGIAGRFYIPTQVAGGTSYYLHNKFGAVTASGSTVSLAFASATATAGTIQKVADNLYVGLFFAGDTEGDYFDYDKKSTTASGAASRTNDVYGIGLSIAWGTTADEVSTAITNYRAAVTGGSITSGESAMVNGSTLNREYFRDWLAGDGIVVSDGTIGNGDGNIHDKKFISSNNPTTATLDIMEGDWLSADTDISEFYGSFIGQGTINLAAGTSMNAARFVTSLSGGSVNTFTGLVTAESDATVNMEGYTNTDGFTAGNNITISNLSGGVVKIGDGYAKQITATGGTAEVTGGTVSASVFDSSAFTSGASITVDSGATLSVADGATTAAAITNAGTVTWDLTSAATGCIGNYQYFTNNGTLSVTVLGENRESGSYVLATNIGADLTGKDTFTINAGSTEIANLSVGTKKYWRGFGYELTRDANGTPDDLSDDKLVLTVTKEQYFSDPNWQDGASVSVTFDGKTYSGTVGDGRFTNDESDLPADTMLVYNGARGGVGLTGETVNASFVNQISGGYRQATGRDTEGVDLSWTISGGIYSKTIAAADTLTAGGSTMTRDGSVSLAITGGTFNQNVAGGMFFNPATGKSQDGNVVLYNSIDLTISGGTFKGRIFGGSNVKSDSMGDCINVDGSITTTFNAADNVITIGEYVVAGNRGTGIVTGNTEVIFSGSGANLVFADDSIVWGGCSKDYIKVTDVRTPSNYVLGTRTLSFTDFSGDFGAEIGMFENIDFSKSNVNFTDAKLDMQDITSWAFDNESEIELGSATNDFAGDTLEISGFTGEKLSLIYADSNDVFKGLFDDSTVVSWNGCGEVKYDGTAAAWSDGTSQLKIETSENKYIMTLSSVSA